MVVSKRERYAVIIAVTVVALLVLDRVFVTPLLARNTDLKKRLELATTERKEADLTIRRSQAAGKKWKEMAGTQLKADATTTESQALNSIYDWARNSGLSLTSVSPEGQPQREKEFMRVTFRATGTGTMRQVGTFLYGIQSASIPVKVTDVQLNSKKEGMDELAIQLGISTVYLAPEDKNPKPAAAGIGAGRPNP